MYQQALFLFAGSLVAMSAMSADMSRVTESFPLEDGSTVYVFKDGKMGMEDKLGRSVRMKPGHVMKTMKGEKLVMIGDEVMKVESILRERRGPGG